MRAAEGQGSIAKQMRPVILSMETYVFQALNSAPLVCASRELGRFV